MPDDRGNIIDVKDLSVSFGGRYRLFKGRSAPVDALKSVSFSLGAGRTLSIVGESGSGKTTLIRSILGLLTPSSGHVALRGREISSMSAAEKIAARHRLGYVPQDSYGSLPPTLSVIGAVTEPWNIARPSSKREGEARAKELLKELGLPEALWKVRAAHSLSGGQRQRVSVARSLILEPEALLCDEPTASQDVSTRGEVLDVLDRHVKNGMSMIIVTHDLMLAQRASENMIVLRGGEIAERGKSREVMTNPSHGYTKKLIASLPKI
ncbi:hypothetical protein FACS1894216_03790 [Synergistales bacterium]|nr:hypothetical protein FACS1894216_03790 [Synergistales bacterium]